MEGGTMKIRWGCSILSVVFLASVWLACGGPPPKEREDPAPVWFDDPPAGCGVGTKRLRGSRSLARDGAVHKARVDLARQLESLTQGLIEEYARDGEEDGMDFSEGQTVDVSRSVAEQTLLGTRPETVLVGNEYFARVCVEPDAYAEVFASMATLSDKARAALAGRARSAFDRLDTQLEKKGAR